MAEQHRATADEWARVKARPAGVAFYSCLFELRDRIEALEAPQSGSIDLSHLSDAEREKMARWIANPGRFEVLEVAQPAKPDSSLKGRVAAAIDNGTTCDRDPERIARAAIRAVAAWFVEKYGVPNQATYLLEQEVKQ